VGPSVGPTLWDASVGECRQTLIYREATVESHGARGSREFRLACQSVALTAPGREACAWEQLWEQARE